MSSNINFDDHQKVTSSKRAKKSAITPGKTTSQIKSQTKLRILFEYLKSASLQENVKLSQQIKIHFVSDLYRVE